MVTIIIIILCDQVGDVKDVYEVVNEDEYSEIVRKRQEDDWVVDDGATGMIYLLIVNISVSSLAASSFHCT